MSASNAQQDQHDEEVVARTNNAAPLPGVDGIGEDPTSNDDTTRAVKPHWRVPAVMVLTLLSGVSLALGHHFFYAQYHGKPVHGSIGQQWVNRIGTGFAFMVQMLLVMTAGSAYVQRQWLSLGSRTHRIDQVDSMFGVLGDVTLFFDKVWFTNLLLALLAGITWWIPLAAVVTPGSLTVEPRVKLHDTTLRPAQLQYNASHFADLNIPGILQYYGPNYITSQIAVASATSGQILQIPSANQNETYSLNFFGPAIRCASNQHVRTAVVEALKVLNATDFDLLAGYIPYAAWVPSDSAHGYPRYNFSSTEAYVTLDASDDDRKRLMVASIDGFSPDGLEKGRDINLKVHECMLYNASYTADFEFEYPNQAVTITSVKTKQPIECNWEASVITVANEYTWGGLGPGNHNVSYMAIMDAFGSVLVGYAYYPLYDYCTDHNGVTYCQHTISTQAGTRFDQTLID